MKYVLAFTLLFGASFSFGTPKTEKEAIQYATVIMDGFHIKKIYTSMTGPLKEKGVALTPEDKFASIWVKSMSVDIFNEKGQKESEEYLCHAWVTIPTPMNEEKYGRVSGMLTISQGMPEMEFPPGYAMKMAKVIDSQVNVLVQALNNVETKIDKKLIYRIKIGYIDDKDAQALGIKQLYGDSFATQVPPEKRHRPPSKPERLGEDPHKGHSMTGMGGADPVHFIVPPGKHEYRWPLSQDMVSIRNNGVIRLIKLHLHPYGESVALYDKTAKKFVWKGTATQDSKRAVLLKTESYSSTEGIKLNNQHSYEVVTTYNNTSKQTVDGMGVLRVYYGLK
ncbi:hypothetical protein [Bdellovibrio bacteriovorus]|uniref:hypothetical protein n=1 Tax=Bdellovibrio bacteriovorus TaxID=959 RepID=UPI0035A613C7